MRNVYLVAYDVCDPKRLRKTYRLMCGAGDPLQFSVFRCELSLTERQALQTKLGDVLNLAEDRVMLVDLGPIEGRGDTCSEYWGKPLTGDPSREAGRPLKNDRFARPPVPKKTPPALAAETPREARS